jgi:imidazolonepropionase-like amidohydrolase
MARTFIHGGTVVCATGSQPLDVLVEGETVVAVLQPGSTALGADLAASADRVLDATGRYVIPGGVDGHTHMQMPFGGTEASDTFETGTRAAAPAPPHGAAPPRSSTSRSRSRESGSRTPSPPGIGRRPGSARSTTASIRSSAR